MKPLLLPWSGSSVPHAILDINRACNIACRGCYNKRSAAHKSLADIEEELHQLLRLRLLHTVTILGGEPTLHPDLDKIIGLAKCHVKKVALVTNGLLFDGTLGKRLKESGLDLVLFHIDRGQIRSDLEKSPSLEQVNNLRIKKVRAALGVGLSVGIQTIGYRGSTEDIVDAVTFVLQTQGVSHLLVTDYTCVGKFKYVSGTLEHGLKAEFNLDRLGNEDELNNQEIGRILASMSYRPFAYVCAHNDHNRKQWLSYQFCSVLTGGRSQCYSMTSSLFERIVIRAAYHLLGRYLFFFKPSPFVLRMQMIMNGLTGGSIGSNFVALIKSLTSCSRLESKHLVFQEGPGLDDGKLVYCRDCPDATLKDGRLVPLCLVDKVVK